MFRRLLFGSLTLALLACDDPAAAPGMSQDDASAGSSDACTPSACGPRPSTPNFVCADGTLGGPGPCERLSDGTCGYPSHACVESDADLPDAALDAQQDAATERDSAAPVPECGAEGSVGCREGQYCELGESMCGALAQGGSCNEQPKECPPVFEPVCACDNRTYDSACLASARGQSLLHKGVCTAAECLAAGGLPAYQVGPEPPSCPLDAESWSIGRPLEPALCCVSKPVPGAVCGGLGGARCRPGLFCDYEPLAGGTGCGIHDGTGVCNLVTDECADEYTPVCGCNFRTYAHRCNAHQFGVSVLHDDVCTDRDCASAGGRVVTSFGTAPVCTKEEQSHGPVKRADGQPYIEGAICCVPL